MTSVPLAVSVKQIERAEELGGAAAANDSATTMATVSMLVCTKRIGIGRAVSISSTDQSTTWEKLYKTEPFSTHYKRPIQMSPFPSFCEFTGYELSLLCACQSINDER